MCKIIIVCYVLVCAYTFNELIEKKRTGHTSLLGEKLGNGYIEF